MMYHCISFPEITVQSRPPFCIRKNAILKSSLQAIAFLLIWGRYLSVPLLETDLCFESKLPAQICFQKGSEQLSPGLIFRFPYVKFRVFLPVWTKIFLNNIMGTNRGVLCAFGVSLLMKYSKLRPQEEQTQNTAFMNA